MSCFDTVNQVPIVTHDIAADESVAVAIVDAVAAVENRQPTALPPLAGTIDTDALAALVASADELCVTFDYAGYRVVATTETVELY